MNDDIEVFANSSFLGSLSGNSNWTTNPSEEIELEIENNSVKIQFDIGNGINVDFVLKKEYHTLSIGANLPNDLKGNFNGLLGNFDGDSTNEFVNRNGTVIADNSSEETIYNEFGQTWKINEDETLFSYKESSGIGYNYYANKSKLFVPVFLDLFKNESLMIDLFSNDTSLMRTANGTCLSKPKQVYFQCMYDSAQTGDPKSGETTGQTFSDGEIQKARQGSSIHDFVGVSLHLLILINHFQFS